MITTSFTWKTEIDPCPECAYLREQTYTQSIFDHAIVDPMMGEIWSLDADHALTHGGQGLRCRCGIEINVAFDFSELVQVVSFMRHGREVTAYRDLATGRFVKGLN